VVLFEVLPDFETLHALCNWGIPVAEATTLVDVPTGFDLSEQLTRFKPHAVLGDGGRIFLITRNGPLMEEFVHLCRRRRTTG
jgi:hypothetical protein